MYNGIRDGNAARFRVQFPEPTKRTEFSGWLSPPLDVLDCVLSLNRRYKEFCLPRVEAFQVAHPEIRTLEELCGLIESYSNPLAFSASELNYRDERRAAILLKLTKYLLRVKQKYEGPTEAAKLKNWATSVKPHDAWTLGVPGFGLAGFQYLRMLFWSTNGEAGHSHSPVRLRGFGAQSQ